MRRGGRALFVVLALATGPVMLVLTASPASAVTQSLTVTKVVDGTAPPGAQYVVDIHCENGVIEPTSPLTFTGPGSQTVTVGPDATCTVVESVASGADVSYACEVTNDPNGDTDCVSDNVAFFALGGAATITVTNTFVPEPSPASVQAAQPAPAEPVTAAARFTG